MAPASTGVFIGIAITGALIVLAIVAMPKTPVAASTPAPSPEADAIAG